MNVRRQIPILLLALKFSQNKPLLSLHGGRADSRLLIKPFSTLHHLTQDSHFHTNTTFSSPLHETTPYTDNNTVKIYLIRKKTLSQVTMIVGHFPQTPRKYHAKHSLMTLLFFCAAYLLYCPRYITQTGFSRDADY